MLVIFGSSRDGNTEQLTNIMLEGVAAERIYLREKNILPITDKRHDPEGFALVPDDYQAIVNTMLAHDTIIFVTPLYWYGMSGYMKNFVDRWSQSLRDRELQFAEKMKNKRMYVVVVGGDQPKIKALPLIMQFQYIFAFLGASFEGHVIGEGNKPADVLADEEAIGQAKYYNRRFLRLNER